MITIPYEQLWRVVSEQYDGGEHSIHGPSHWRRVERNGLILADSIPNVDFDVIRLFALFHDSKRENDGQDPGHGLRGAEFAKSLLGQKIDGQQFDFEPVRFNLLYTACQLHTDQVHHENQTVGCCMDADRLDLPRVGIHTAAKYLNTELGKQIANDGGMQTFLDS